MDLPSGYTYNLVSAKKDPFVFTAKYCPQERHWVTYIEAFDEAFINDTIEGLTEDVKVSLERFYLKRVWACSSKDILDLCIELRDNWSCFHMFTGRF